MMRKIIVLLIVLCVMPQPAMADNVGDECPDDGWELDEYYDGSSKEGAYWSNVAIDTPHDRDSWTWAVNKGDYLLLRLDVPDDESNLKISLVQNVPNGGFYRPSITETSNLERENGYTYYISDNDEPATMKIFAEGDEPICVSFEEDGRFSTSYNYEVYWAQNTGTDWYSDAKQTPTTTTESPTTTTESPTTTTDTIASDDRSEDTPSSIEDDGNSGNEIQDSDGDGVIDSKDYAPNDPEVQEKSDLQKTSGGSLAGFGIDVAIVAILATTFVALRRSK